jgi:hypothetical protein
MMSARTMIQPAIQKGALLAVANVSASMVAAGMGAPVVGG